MFPRRAAALPLVVALTLVGGDARADARAEDADVARRIAWIEARLARGTGAADRWWTGWYVGFTALTVGQGAVAVATTDPGLRADMAVGAVGASLGVAPLGLFPFEPRFAASDLAAEAGGTAGERRRKLAVAERLLAESADAEAFGRSWAVHLLGGGVSLGLGLVLAIAYDRLASGILNFVGGVALTELSIFTQPTDAIDAWREYRSGTFGPRASGLGFRF